MSGFTNKPKILRGAFIEYGLSLPPLFVVFQFNPEQVTRSRSLSFSIPGNEQGTNLRAVHNSDKYEDLEQIYKDQRVEVDEEKINFEIRLDATDQLNAGNALAEQFGIAPQLATLELLLLPKEESLIGVAVGALFEKKEGFSFTQGQNPPLILFIWGRKRVLPVNINNMSITETMFSSDLNPLRATVDVNLTVIEGKNKFAKYSKAMLEVMSVLNLANIADVANVIVPG